MNKDQKPENKIRMKSKLGIRSSNQKQKEANYIEYLYLAYELIEDEAVIAACSVTDIKKASIRENGTRLE